MAGSLHGDSTLPAWLLAYHPNPLPSYCDRFLCDSVGISSRAVPHVEQLSHPTKVTCSIVLSVAVDVVTDCEHLGERVVTVSEPYHSVDQLGLASNRLETTVYLPTQLTGVSFPEGTVT